MQKKTNDTLTSPARDTLTLSLRVLEWIQYYFSMQVHHYLVLQPNPDCHKSEWFHSKFKRSRFYFSLLQFGDYPDKGASDRIILIIIGSLPRYLFAHQWWIQPPHWRVQAHGRTWNTSQPLHPGVKNYKNSYFKSSLIIDFTKLFIKLITV